MPRQEGGQPIPEEGVPEVFRWIRERHLAAVSVKLRSVMTGLVSPSPRSRLCLPSAPRRWAWLPCLLVWIALAGALPAAAQDAPAAPPATGEAADSQGGAADSEVFPPPDFEIVPRILQLEEKSASLRREIQGFGDLAPLDATVEELENRQLALADRLDQLPDGGVLSADQVARLRLQATQTRERLDELLASLAERSERIEALRAEWQSERDFFRRWRREVARRGGARAQARQLADAVSEVEDDLRSLEEASGPFLELQRRVQVLVQNNRAQIDRTEQLVQLWESRLRTRTTPFLFSAEYGERLRESFGPELTAELREAARIPGGFIRDNLVRIGCHLLVLLGIGVAARRLRELTRDSLRWQGLLSHPWSLGVFASVLLFGGTYEPAPAAWRLLLAAALAASLALIAHATFRRARRRRTAYLLAAIYFVFQASEAVGLPAPLYRLLILALCVLPPILFFRMAAGEVADEGRNTYFSYLLRAAGTALLVVSLGDLLGYHLLARWILKAALDTTFLVFIITFLVRLVRRVLARIFRASWVERSAFWSRVAPEASRRLGRLARVVLVGVGVLYAASFWDLGSAPLSIWRRVVAGSFDLGRVRISVGQVLLAAAALYAAFIISRIIRALVDTQASDLHVSPGVGDSIKTLVHYSLILLGLLFALLSLGIPLTSFALVAGALGVGIGFGLQDVVNNFLSGLILLFERPVRVGDTVVIDGQWGVVRRIGLRSTVLKTFDHAELIVPNGKLISQTVTNWTLSDRTARMVATIGVAYGSDYDRVRELLAEVCAAHPHVLEEPEPLVTLASFGDSSVLFEVRAWIDNIDNRLVSHGDILRETARRFASEDITIPFPQRDLHVRTFPVQEAREAARPGAAPESGDGEGGGASGAPAAAKVEADRPVASGAEAPAAGSAEEGGEDSTAPPRAG